MREHVNRDKLVKVGWDRLEDARFLQAQPAQSRPDGALYIAGYSIECWLKAAILKGMDEDSSDKLDSDEQAVFFKHEYRKLVDRFADKLPVAVLAAVDALPEPVRNWNPQWRYRRSGRKREEAEMFVAAADEFWKAVRGAV